MNSQSNTIRIPILILSDKLSTYLTKKKPFSILIAVNKQVQLFHKITVNIFENFIPHETCLQRQRSSLGDKTDRNYS